MAHQVVSAIFPGAAAGPSTYTSDRGVDVPGLGFRFNQPHDFSAANVDAILTALGARRKTPADKNLCPVSASDFKPRKLTFVRRSGNSFSVVMPKLSSITSIGTTVKGIIDGIGTDDVACALLSGEEWEDLIPELRGPAAFTPAPAKSTKPASGGKQPIHSGKILYEFDGGSTTVPISVKVATDDLTNDGVSSPPTLLGGTWANCVGPFEPKLPCSSSGSWKHRRYILVSRVVDDIAAGVSATNPTRYESTEIPIKNREAAEILSCGQALAQLPHSVCLKYRGESNGRFHVLI